MQGNIIVFKGYFNDFNLILLYFVTFATLLQIWYCKKLHTFGVKKMTFCMPG